MGDNTVACNCPNVNCKRHGNCAECRKNHNYKTMYCAVRDGSLRKKLTDLLFGRKKS
jgi:hypothetical protein